MWWPTTVLGAAAGFAMANIPGALLGGLLGQAMDRRLQLRTWDDVRARLRGRSSLNEQEVLFLLLGRLAKSDGQVLPSHIHQARQEMVRLAMGPAAQRQAVEAFNRGKAGKTSLGGYLARLGTHVGTAEETLHACLRMAWADGKLGVQERALLLAWGRQMGLTRERTHVLAEAYEPSRQVARAPALTYLTALRMLDVDPETPAPAVKQAYRRLLSRHHPDKLLGSGASAARVAEATERTRQLHQAYALVRQRLEQ